MELNEYLDFLDRVLEEEIEKHRLYRKVALHFGREVDVIYYPYTNTLAFNEDNDEDGKVTREEVQEFAESVERLNCKVSIYDEDTDKRIYIME